MFKTVNQEKFRCQVGFFEAMNEKYLKEKQKSQKFRNFIITQLL